MREAVSVVLAVAFVTLLVTVLAMESRSGGERERRPDGPPAVTERADEAERGGHQEPGFFPRKLHELAGFTVLIFGVVHVLYNGRRLLSYVGIRRSRTADTDPPVA